MCFFTKKNTVFDGVRAADDKGGFLLRSTQGSMSIVDIQSSICAHSQTQPTT